MRASVLAAISILALSAAAAGQNLIADGGFASSLEAWHHDPNANGSSAWSPEDRAASGGSALLISTAATGGILISLLSQCVPVASGQSYMLGQVAKFADGETATGWAETVVTWYSGAICTNRVGANSILTAKASPVDWAATNDTFTAPVGAASALVEVGVDKIEAGGTLTAWVDDVSFAPVAEPNTFPDVHYSFLPVVGSVSGSFGSLFRTSLTILNPNSAPLSGQLIFHPAGQPDSASDPSVGYSLAPGQSFAWYDVVAAMGLSGLGSMDVTWWNLDVPPIVVTRIFNDAGDAGTSGFAEPTFIGPDQYICCPPPDLVGHLLPPSDLQRYRYNVGVRTLVTPIQMTVEVLDEAGTVVHTSNRTYTHATFQQTTADEFAGVTLESGQSIQVTASPFFAIVYGATVDNTTNDSSAQFLTTFWRMEP